MKKYNQTLLIFVPDIVVIFRIKIVQYLHVSRVPLQHVVTTIKISSTMHIFIEIRCTLITSTPIYQLSFDFASSTQLQLPYGTYQILYRVIHQSPSSSFVFFDNQRIYSSSDFWRRCLSPEDHIIFKNGNSIVSLIYSYLYRKI